MKQVLPRRIHYEYQKNQFRGRNSYSKTDTDATFMRMKDDHMRNGQLKPGYNVQIGTENGFVTAYELFPNPSDMRTLVPFLETYARQYSTVPQHLIADKGYASIENYEYLESRNIAGYIKYAHWDQEKKVRSPKHRYASWRFRYDKEKDEFTCPEGKILPFVSHSVRIRFDGSKEPTKRYRCQDCTLCPVRLKCTEAEFRTIEFNYRRHELQQKARERLKTEEGTNLYRKRSSEVETVFGQVKGNWGFRRFTMGGKQKVACEWGIHMIAYNLKNLVAKKP